MCGFQGIGFLCSAVALQGGRGHVVVQVGEVVGGDVGLGLRNQVRAGVAFGLVDAPVVVGDGPPEVGGLELDTRAAVDPPCPVEPGRGRIKRREVRQTNGPGSGHAIILCLRPGFLY